MLLFFLCLKRPKRKIIFIDDILNQKIYYRVIKMWLSNKEGGGAFVLTVPGCENMNE